MRKAKPEQHSEKHYVQEYEAYVTRMQGLFDHDEAMAYAVGGGDFAKVGGWELGLLTASGLQAGQRIIDVGCGSGRLAAALSERFGDQISYLGLDIVQTMLDYAKTVSHGSYQFEMNTELSIPAPDASCDFIVFFSVVTHLLHEESFRYLRDARRALKPDGRLAITFLESKQNWSIFERVVEVSEHPEIKEPLVMFIERPMLEVWADRLELQIEKIISPGPGEQMFAVLRPISA
ncbi:MAG: class I SAM-dependent methyltransferase [Pseudolysinimonas sp.]